MDGDLVRILVEAVVALALGGGWIADRARLSRRTRDAEAGENGAIAAASSVISVREAERRVVAAQREADRAAEFAALRKLVEDHHGDDVREFARIESELTRLRDHRHEFDTWRTRHEFWIDELRRDAGLITNPGVEPRKPLKPTRPR